MMSERSRKRKSGWSIATAIGLAAVVAVGVLTKDHWQPVLSNWTQLAQATPAEDSHAHDDHDHDHGSGAGPMPTSLKLSENGLKNIGYQPLVIKPGIYQKKLTLPAIVVERPGRSQLHVTAPLTGVVTQIFAVTGEAIDAGSPLFEMRLTHEELVAAQRELLRTAESLDVVQREIRRLQSLGDRVIAGKRVLEQQYEEQKLQASLKAEKQALLLHGLDEQQVDKMIRTRELFKTITVETPPYARGDHACEGSHHYLLQHLDVAKGEQIETGQELAMLADHCLLHIEGSAFEDDAQLIRAASQAGWKITAEPLAGDDHPVISDLQVLYIAGQVDRQSRELKVFLNLPNEIAHQRKSESGKSFLEWKYKPGQRMQIHIPVDRQENQLVVPTTAVVQEGAEHYVYRQNGDYFEQVSVYVTQRDQQAVVISNDGTLFSGDVIAATGAYEMHLALKNSAGGGVDPHAGHSH